MVIKHKLGSSSGVVANILDCNVTVREFEHQLGYYIHFWTNTLGKCMKSVMR